MSSGWKSYVQQEFLETDDDFVESLPYQSINTSTFGLISEAVTFILVEFEDGIHIRPTTSGLSELKNALQDSSGPSGNFEIDNARDCLTEFARQWEKNIKDHHKWDKVIEMARQESDILSQEEYQTEHSKTGLWNKIRNFFT